MASEMDRSAFPRDPSLTSQPGDAAEAGEEPAACSITRRARGAATDQCAAPQAAGPEALKLADAQLVVARGYGFDSWAGMRRKIESLTRTPVEQFGSALRAGDVEQVRTLLEGHADVRAAVNGPVGAFGGRPAMMARRNLPMIDLLIAYGADLNLKSDWWAGPFGLLETDLTPDEAAPLIARGAIVDVVAAAHLGLFERVRELVDADPSLVFARGGDGKTALHCATHRRDRALPARSWCRHRCPGCRSRIDRRRSI